MFGEHPADHVLVDLDAEGSPDDERNLRTAEPRIALTPGPSGLEALEIIIGQAPLYLVPDGWLIIEHGYDQQAPVARLLRAAGFGDIRCDSDHNDLPRASQGRLGAA